VSSNRSHPAETWVKILSHGGAETFRTAIGFLLSSWATRRVEVLTRSEKTSGGGQIKQM